MECCSLLLLASIETNFYGWALPPLPGPAGLLSVLTPSRQDGARSIEVSEDQRISNLIGHVSKAGPSRAVAGPGPVSGRRPS